MATTATQAQPTTFLRLDTQAPHYKWLVATIVLVAGATQIFAGTSVNIVIPRLMAAFGTDLAATQWVATGFLLTRTLVMPLFGWLGGMVGNRNMFVAIMTGFVLTTAGCGLATSLPMLIAIRMIQGLILGTMESLTAVILVTVFPIHQRGLALGLRSVGWSAGQVIFYVIGGYLIEQVSWRLVFFLGIPTGIAAIVGGWLVLQQQRESRNEPVDHLGLITLGGFLVPLLLMISWGRDSATEVSTLVLLGLCAVVVGGLFIVRELFTPFPAVNVRLFRLPGFRLVCLSAFLNNMGLFGALFMVPIFLQQVIGLTPLQAGLVIVPALIISGGSGVLVGRLTDILPPPVVVITMMLSLAAIFYAFSSVSALTALTVLVGYVILYRVCMTGGMTPLALLTVQELEAEQMRMGQGLLGVTRSIGASLGVTVTSVFFEWQRTAHQLQAYQAYDNNSPMHYDLLGELKLAFQQVGILGGAAERMALSSIRRQMDVEAIAAGFQDSFLLVCTCFVLASLPMTYFLLKYYRPRRV